MDGLPEESADERDDPFGARLRRARETAGLAQEELAARAGLAPNTVGALERGEHRRPYPATVRALAAALGLTEAERAALATGTSRRREDSARAGSALLGVPASLTPLVGREEEVGAVADLLRREGRPEGSRLVTLTGPGGVGKTRLALQVAADWANGFADGAVFVSLAAVRDPAVVGPTIASVLGMIGGGWRTPEEGLGDALQASHLLLVLDNFEQVLPAAPLVTGLLLRCPRLTVLVTSRAVLRVEGERVYPVPPLAVPDPERLPIVERLAAVGSVRLFVERAQAADPSFRLSPANAGAVAAICHRLDGLPLAIELAASRSYVLSPNAMLPRLAQRLPLLTEGRRDAPDRHRTMRDAIAWSYGLLPAEEQAVFRRLSVFTGGFTLEAAASVATATGEASGDVLAGISVLAEHSLLRREEATGDIPRYLMLETVREFGLEQLAASGDLDTVRSAHAAYFSTLDDHLDPNRLDFGGTLDERLRLTELDHSNLLAALEWMAETGDPVGVLRLAGSLAAFWHHRGYLREGRRWLEWALEHTIGAPPLWRCQGLIGLSMVIYAQADPAGAAGPAAAALEIAREIGDLHLTARAIHMLGLTEMTRGRWERAEALMSETLRLQLELGVPGYGAMALIALSAIAHERGDLALSARRAEEALAIFRASGHNSGKAMALARLAQLAADRRDDKAALVAYQEALRLWAGIGERWAIVQALAGVAALAAAHGVPETAALLVGAIDARLDEGGATLFPGDRPRYERAAAAARDALGNLRLFDLRDVGRVTRLPDLVAIANAVTVSAASGVAKGPAQASLDRYGLTEREWDVLRLLAEGHSDREIAAALFISPKTAGAHVSRLLAKLGVPSRAAAVAHVHRHDLI